MKRLAVFAAAAALLLCGCRVGPREGKDLITSDAPVSAAPPFSSEPSVSSEDTFSEMLVPVPSEAVTEPTQPQEQESSETQEIPQLPDFDFDVEVFDAPLTVYSTSRLNIRKGPSVDYNSIGYLSKGDETVAYGEADGWYLIPFEDGFGFVSGGYMSEEPVLPDED